MNLKDLMGQIVTVQKEYKRNYNKKYHISDVKPRAGWIVGKRTIYSGYNDYYDNWPVFIPTETHECLLVSYWPTMNPVKVPLDGFVLGGDPEHFNKGWEEKWKDEQREAMKNWPRRPNGQWKAYAELTKEERQNLY
jgi:hypothetical protein